MKVTHNKSLTTLVVGILSIALASTLSVHAQSADNVYTEVEQMPEYPGGMEALTSFVQKELKYPKAERKSGTEGIVFVSFVVGKDGKISNVTVLKGVADSLDKEAERVVKQLPAWIPGKKNGEAVAVQMVLPINFAL